MVNLLAGNALALLVRQLGDLRILRDVILGFSEEAKTRGFPSPSLGGFGFIRVSVALSIVAAWRIGGRSRTSAYDPKRTLISI